MTNAFCFWDLPISPLYIYINGINKRKPLGKRQAVKIIRADFVCYAHTQRITYLKEQATQISLSLFERLHFQQSV